MARKGQNIASGTRVRCGRGCGYVLAVVCVALAVIGCAQTKTFVTSKELTQAPGTARVLLMPPDIELSEITAGGLHEPKAAWTKTAKGHVDAALDDVLAESGTRVVRYRAANPDQSFDKDHIQLVKLHEAVGGSIILHKYISQFALPTKKDRFDWSLGQDVAVLREDYDADYALFVLLRDSFVSGGRVAVIAIAAIFGFGVQDGTQIGFASLVDLRTGEVVWFNHLASGTGDLRKPESARGATKSLLSELPL